MRQREEEEEENFNFLASSFAVHNKRLSCLSMTAAINISTGLILGFWSIILVTSIIPITTGTAAGRGDLAETILEIVEKILYFVSATTKSGLWRATTFLVVSAYSIVKKALEIHYDTAPERTANSSWAFIGAIMAKLFEHLAYAARFKPTTKAWAFWTSGGGGCGKNRAGLSNEQLARRHLWAREYYKKHLSASYQEFVHSLEGVERAGTGRERR